MRTADQVIEELGMQPIPDEGAWLVQGPRVPGLSTILALLIDRADGFSALHRLEIDEGWQWLDGAAASMLRLAPDGTGRRTILDTGHPQLIVPRGTWQGAGTLGDWTLVACWCSPAFEDEHFALGARAELATAYPAFAAEIAVLTRDPS